MSVGTAGEKGEEAVAGGADGAKYTNGEECDAEVSRGGRESARANEAVLILAQPLRGPLAWW